ncbi:MAG: HAD-IIA family hydrolase [Candidatus Marinimicrobia bacterium]|nr:HAD-IIA family hydrolase [Candidatus Neomarinimicrobiota bacterium]
MMEQEKTQTAKREAAIKKAFARVKALILDLDGTLYLGDKLFEYTPNFLDGLTKRNLRYIFVSNNSSKTAQDYARKLNRMGLSVTDEMVYTSTEATIEYLDRLKPNANIYLIGTPALESQFRAAGYVMDDESPDFVVLGFDTTFNYVKFHHGCYWLRRGVPFIATHPDLNCPVTNGESMPDAGALAAAFTAATGVHPKYIGKPYREMLHGITTRMKLRIQDFAVVGDRLSTDISMGFHNHIPTALVQSGGNSPQFNDHSDVQPTVVVDRVVDLLPYLPPVE